MMTMMMNGCNNDHKIKIKKKRFHLLVLCDIQPVVLNSISNEEERNKFVDLIQIAYQVAKIKQQNHRNDGDEGNMIVLKVGLQFDVGYPNVSSNHILYGGMKRLHDKVGPSYAKWFTSNASNDETHFHPCICNGGDDSNDNNGVSDAEDIILWRKTHLVSSEELTRVILQKIHQLNGIDACDSTKTDTNSNSDPYLEVCDSILSATVIGLKLSTTIQGVVQTLCNIGIGKIIIVKDCISDGTTTTSTSTSNDNGISDNGNSDKQRYDAIMDHLLPIYTTDIIDTLPEWIDTMVGLDTYSEYIAASTTTTTAATANTGDTGNRRQMYNYLCDCNRGGHFGLYAANLLLMNSQKKKTPKSSNWRVYPTQVWYQDLINTGRTYVCPLGKKLVEFCDEPQFSSTISMYIKGREYLDEKDKLYTMLSLVVVGNDGSGSDSAGSGGLSSLMPPHTYVVQNGTLLNTPSSPSSSNNNKDVTALADVVNDDGPWFVKDCEQNAGRAIRICSTFEEAIQIAKDEQQEARRNHRSNCRHLLQAHLRNPLLIPITNQKFSIKLYSLLVQRWEQQKAKESEDCVIPVWYLYTFSNSYLCISSNPWSTQDLDSKTQISTLRHVKLGRTTTYYSTDSHNNSGGDDSTSIDEKEIHRCMMGWPTIEGDKQQAPKGVTGGNDVGYNCFYSQCQSKVHLIVEHAIQQKKLQTRQRRVQNGNHHQQQQIQYQDQFELFSVDFMVDTYGKVWLLECNFSPVLFDPVAYPQQPLTTIGLNLYRQQYDTLGPKHAVINDHEMLAQTMSIVFPPTNNKTDSNNTITTTTTTETPPSPGSKEFALTDSQWDLIGKIRGPEEEQ